MSLRRRSYFGRGERFVHDISKASTGFEFTRHWFMWFPAKHPPFSKQRNPILLLSEGKPPTPPPPPERKTPPTPPPSTHPHPNHHHTAREREREREREGKTNLPQIDQNYNPEKTMNAHPKTINAPFAERGVYGFP